MTLFKKKKDKHKIVMLLKMATIFSIVVSTCLRNDLYAFKKKFSGHFILFLYKTILKRTNI